METYAAYCSYVRTAFSFMGLYSPSLLKPARFFKLFALPDGPSFLFYDEKISVRPFIRTFPLVAVSHCFIDEFFPPFGCITTLQSQRFLIPCPTHSNIFPFGSLQLSGNTPVSTNDVFVASPIPCSPPLESRSGALFANRVRRQYLIRPFERREAWPRTPHSQLAFSLIPISASIRPELLQKQKLAACSILFF